MPPLVRVDRDAEVLRLTLDSPDNRNALSVRLLDELHAALDDLGRARVVVLDHTGPAFSSGADLRERDRGIVDHDGISRLLERLPRLPVPVIAAVRGAVRAGGMGVVAACDLIVAHPAATFACPEVRVGVAPAMIAVPLLQRCGWAHLAEPFLTGAAFDATRARSMGLVSIIDADVDTAVTTLCAAITANAPHALEVTKGLLRGGTPTMPEMRRLSAEMFDGAEAAEGMRAFLERRPPQWPPRDS